MRRNLKKHIVSLVGVGAFVILAVGSKDTATENAKDDAGNNARETQTERAQAADFTMAANKLYREYDANEVAADSKYKGKIVIVSGTIQDIGKDVMDNAFIVIGGESGFDGVQCTFAEEETASVARLSKGQQVTVKGEVTGKMGNVLLESAQIQ